jgi:phosphatidylserine/phosphatidylglycerophosphate/cardiolipin synthase-like enzyme
MIFSGGRLRWLLFAAIGLLTQVGAPAQPARSWPTAVPATIATCLVPGCDATAFIVAAIDGAQREIRGQAYNFTNQSIIDALVRARRRGIDVAMLLDKLSPCQRGEGVDTLAAAGIPVLIDAQPRIAHNKVLIIDRSSVVLGSFNFSASAMRNAEDTNLVSGDALAARFLSYWRERREVATPYGGRALWCRPARRLRAPA